MEIELLYCVIKYPDAWEEAYRHLENEKWKKWANKHYDPFVDPMTGLPADDHMTDALQYLGFGNGSKKT